MLRSSRCTLSSGPAAFIQKRCRSPQRFEGIDGNCPLCTIRDNLQGGYHSSRDSLHGVHHQARENMTPAAYYLCRKCKQAVGARPSSFMHSTVYQWVLILLACLRTRVPGTCSLLFAQWAGARACRAEWQGPGPPERTRAPRLGQVGQGTEPRQAARKLMDHIPCGRLKHAQAIKAAPPPFLSLLREKTVGFLCRFRQLNAAVGATAQESAPAPAAWKGWGWMRHMHACGVYGLQ